jgi:hypothetical protein
MSGDLQLQIYNAVDGSSFHPSLYPDLTPEQLIRLPVRYVLGPDIRSGNGSIWLVTDDARFETLHPGLVDLAVEAMMSGHIISLRGRITAPVDDIYHGLLHAFREAVASKVGQA